MMGCREVAAYCPLHPCHDSRAVANHIWAKKQWSSDEAVRISSHARAALMAHRRLAWPIFTEDNSTSVGHCYLLVLQPCQSYANIDRTRVSMDISIAAYCDTWVSHTSTSGRGPEEARAAILHMLNAGRNHVIRPRQRFVMPSPQHRDIILIPFGHAPTNTARFAQTQPVGMFSTAAHLEEVMLPNPAGRTARQRGRWWAARLGCGSADTMNHTTQQPLASQRLREVARRRISLALSLAETQYAQIHGEFFQGLGHLRQAANTRSARRQREAESAKEAAAQTDIALRGPEVDDQTAGQAANGSTMEHGGEDDAATRAVAGTMYMHATSVKRTAARKREEKESEQKQGVDGLAFYAEMGKRMSDPAHRQLMHATRKDEKAARDAANSITVHLTSARRHWGGKRQWG